MKRQFRLIEERMSGGAPMFQIESRWVCWRFATFWGYVSGSTTYDKTMAEQRFTEVARNNKPLVTRHVLKTA